MQIYDLLFDISFFSFLFAKYVERAKNIKANASVGTPALHALWFYSFTENDIQLLMHAKP